jgi:hypothetical protein
MNNNPTGINQYTKFGAARKTAVKAHKTVNKAAKKVDAANKKVGAAKDSVSRARGARRETGRRIQSSREMNAYSRLNDASSKLWTAKSVPHKMKYKRVK